MNLQRINKKAEEMIPLLARLQLVNCGSRKAMKQRGTEKTQKIQLSDIEHLAETLTRI